MAKATKYTIALRAGLNRDASKYDHVNGKEYAFEEGPILGRGHPDHDAGFTKMIPKDDDYPEDAPKYICSADLNGYEEAKAEKALKERTEAVANAATKRKSKTA